MSDLLKLSLALEDRQLRRRVFAALVMRANTLKPRTDNLGLFGRLVLAEPESHHWDDFMFPVVADPDVLDAIALSPHNDAVFATNVTDDQITDIIIREVNQNHQKYLPAGGTDEGEES